MFQRSQQLGRVVEPGKGFASAVKVFDAFFDCATGKFIEATAQFFPSDNPFDGRLRWMAGVVSKPTGVLPMGKVSPTLDNGWLVSLGYCFLEDVNWA